MMRKLSFVVIVTFCRQMSPVMQSGAALFCVFLVMILELTCHPFAVTLYDVLEETTTVCETLLMVRGL